MHEPALRAAAKPGGTGRLGGPALPSHSPIEPPAEPNKAMGRQLAQLATEMDALELLPFSDARAAFGPAAALERRARRLGAEDLIRRAQLVQADVLGRIGKQTASGQVLREINAWAAANANQHLLARSHRLLANFFDSIGDLPSAWQHALRAVELLGDTASDRVRAEHLFGLGMALHRTGAHDAARRRYAGALRLSEGAGDIPLQLKILNNLAWLEDDAGNAKRAMEIARRMLGFAAEHGVDLDVGCLDTVAHAQIGLGVPAEAEATLRPILDDPGLESRESEGLAEALNTAAMAQRLQGKLDRAQATIDRCLRICEERGLLRNRVEALEELAFLHAAAGRFQDAYRQYIEFHEADLALRSAEREANSRTLHAVFETEEARFEGERFRELALRDALTGLRNRRYVDHELPGLIARAIVDGVPLTVGLVDVDHFKLVNDNHSHAVGDQVLCRLADIITGATAESGMAARMGGEEFLIVLTGEDALDRLEQLRLRVEAHPWHRVADGLRLTISVGATRLEPARLTQAALLGQADRNLYAAKAAGRNRLVGDPD